MKKENKVSTAKSHNVWFTFHDGQPHLYQSMSQTLSASLQLLTEGQWQETVLVYHIAIKRRKLQIECTCGYENQHENQSEIMFSCSHCSIINLRKLRNSNLRKLHNSNLRKLHNSNNITQAFTDKSFYWNELSAVRLQPSTG